MEICYLHEKPEYAAAVAEMMHRQFGDLSSRSAYEELIQHSLTPNQLPMELIALENRELIATVGIWRADLVSRQDLFPWLGCLVVSPEHRGKGYGGAILKAAVEACRELGFKDVYLYTKLDSFYEKQGWAYIDSGHELDGSLQKIYRLHLG